MITRKNGRSKSGGMISGLDQYSDHELQSELRSIQEQIESSDDLIFSYFCGVAGYLPDQIDLKDRAAAIKAEIDRRNK